MVTELLPEPSVHVTSIVYTRPVPERSARSSTVKAPVITQSGAVCPRASGHGHVAGPAASPVAGQHPEIDIGLASQVHRYSSLKSDLPKVLELIKRLPSDLTIWLEGAELQVEVMGGHGRRGVEEVG